MEECNPFEKKRRYDNVLVKNNHVFPMKKKIILPKLKTSQTAPARITGHFPRKQKPSQDFSELYNEKYTYRKHSKLLTPLSQRQDSKNHCPTPSCSSPSYSDYCTSDYGDSQFSEITEFPEFDSGFLETLNKEVSKRVISGMVLTTKCGKKAQDISEKHLGKRVEKFLGRSVPVSVTSRPPRPPRVLTPLASPRQQSGNTWCLKQQKVSKVLSDSLRAVYKSREDNCRYIRAPLTPIPSTEWVFDTCEKTDRIL